MRHFLILLVACVCLQGALGTEPSTQPVTLEQAKQWLPVVDSTKGLAKAVAFRAEVLDMEWLVAVAPPDRWMMRIINRKTKAPALIYASPESLAYDFVGGRLVHSTKVAWDARLTNRDSGTQFNIQFVGDPTSKKDDTVLIDLRGILDGWKNQRVSRESDGRAVITGTGPNSGAALIAILDPESAQPFVTVRMMDAKTGETVISVTREDPGVLNRMLATMPDFRELHGDVPIVEFDGDTIRSPLVAFGLLTSSLRAMNGEETMQGIFEKKFGAVDWDQIHRSDALLSKKLADWYHRTGAAPTTGPSK